VKRLAALVFVLVLVVVALVSAGKNRTSTTINSSPPPRITMRAPSSDTQAGVSLTHCDQNITVGPHTSCGFADNVFKAYAAALHAAPRTPANYSFQASSPATGKSYALSCSASEGSNSTATCSTGTGATVTFPVQAARVYNTSGSARRTTGDEAPPPAGASGE
jgi:serine/threonine-protein kinase